MFLKEFFNDININKDDKLYLGLLFFFSIAILVVMIKFHQSRGALNSDLFVYLAGGLDFANMNYNHISNPSWVHNSPVIIFLISLFFRLGFVDITSSFIVNGIFGIIGIFGMYTLLKIKFSPLLSFLGAILYNSFSLTLFYFANGMLDTSAVAMLIWTLIFTVAAVDKNPKYYILVSIFFSISFFTRYTMGYIISLILLYMIKKHDIVNLIECLFIDKKVFKDKIIQFFKSYEFKWILLSIFVGVAIFSYTFYVLLSFYPVLPYFGMAQGSINGFVNPKDLNYIPDKLFFIKNFFNLLFAGNISFNPVEKFSNPSFFSYFIVIIGISGVILKAINIFKNINFYKHNYTPLKCRNKYSKLSLELLIIVLLICGVVGFKYNYLVTLLCFWCVFIIILSLAKEYPINFDSFAQYILLLALFIFYFVIVSFVDLKCVRYILPAFPGLIFLFIYSLNYILELITERFGNDKFLFNEDKKFLKNEYSFSFKNVISKGIPIILIVVCLFFAFNFTTTVDHNEDYLDRVEFCDLIKEYDPDYQSKDFLCKWDLRYFEWYLNKDILKFGEDVSKIDSNDYDYIITYKKPFKDDNYEVVIKEGGYYLNENMYRK